jgi:hypothetical protein
MEKMILKMRRYDLEESCDGYFQVLSQNCPGETEENPEDPQPGF